MADDPVRSTGMALREKHPAAPGSIVLKGENGRTVIQTEVVAKIAGLAVREVSGVHKLVPYGAGQSVASLASAITRSDIKDLGVQVEVGQKEAAIDVRIITDYGANIPEIARSIRQVVAERIASMTGLVVVEVNIDIVDLYFGQDDDGLSPRDARVE
ncbi:MAG: Asp23/Gls24 family envelope stress response protein [Rhodothermales bacterium]|nr:Asp23/Gls24 family envelope stress response protein [Rhodothermales bacterium]